MRIKIDYIKNIINDVFKNVELLHFEEVYEKSKRGYKYIIFLHNYFYKENNILYTKFIFYLDENKEYIIKKHFKYLYDINCVFKVVNFSDIDDMKSKIVDILENNKYGDDIKKLSSFILSPSTNINKWLFDNGVNDVSINVVKYSPKILVIGCEYLTFDFDINNQNNNINMNIKKDENLFIISFVLFNDVKVFTIEDIDDLVNIIGQHVKEQN